MQLRSVFCRTACVTVAALGLLASSASAQQNVLTVEVNKLEDLANGSCQAYFLFDNNTQTRFDEFDMALAVFGQSGVIERLVTLEAAPLPQGRKTLKLFEFPDLACDEIGELLLHDLPNCSGSGPETAPVDCFSVLTLQSKSQARLVK